MHQQGVLHLDIKPDNILLSKSYQNGSNALNIKIGDFGTAIHVTAMDTQDDEIDTGDPRYAAPETTFSDRHLDGKADVFSFGVVMVQLITKLDPTDGEKSFPIAQEVETSFTSEHERACHIFLIDTIKQMLERDWNKRPSAEEILAKWQNIPDCASIPIYSIGGNRFLTHSRTASESSSSLSDDKGT